MDHHHESHQTESTEAEGDQPEPQDQPTGSTDGDAISGTGGVLDLIAQVDEQLHRIRNAQQAQDEELTSLTERFRQLESSERANERERQSLEADREAMAQRQEELEQLQIELGREREAWEQEQREREHHLAEQHESLRQREEELTRRQEELHHELDRLRDREEHIQQQGEAMGRERDDLNDRIEEAEKRSAEAEASVAELSERLAAAERQRDTSQQQLAEHKQQLDLAGTKLREFSEALAQQNDQLNQAASAVAVVKQQERRIAELQEQLSAASTDDQQQGEAYDELTKQLHERDQHIESLNETIGQLRQQLTELEERNSTDAADEANENKLASTDDREAEMNALRDRIAELEQELTAAKEQGQQATEEQYRDAEAMREKARRIAQVATHVRRRHSRLKRMRALLRERMSSRESRLGEATDAPDATATHVQHESLMQQTQEIEQQREHVRQMRAALAATERAMIAKWAKPRTVTVMLGVLVVLAANIAGAWWLTNQFAPAEQTASITIEPRAGAGRSMEQADAERWQQWHAAVVQDESFIRSLATRLRQRRLDDYSDPAQLKGMMNDRLSIDLGPNGQITYTLSGHDAASLTGLLDVLASTLVIESDRQASMRGDRVLAVARNEREEGGSLRYALVNQWTLQDDRLFWMLPFLAGTLALTALIMWVIYARLIRAKQLFDESIDCGVDG